MLYNTGAVVTCLTLDTFQRHFSTAKWENHQTNIIGASNTDLKLYGIYTLPVGYKDKEAWGIGP